MHATTVRSLPSRSMKQQTHSTLYVAWHRRYNRRCDAWKRRFNKLRGLVWKYKACNTVCQWYSDGPLPWLGKVSKIILSFGESFAQDDTVPTWNFTGSNWKLGGRLSEYSTLFHGRWELMLVICRRKLFVSDELVFISFCANLNSTPC